MADEKTSLRGVMLRTIEGRKMILVDVRAAFGDAPSIAQLAAKVRLEPRVVLDAILTYTANAPIRETLFDDQVGKEPRPSATKQRTALMRLAVENQNSTSGRTR